MFPSPIGVFLFICRQLLVILQTETVSVPYRGLSFYMNNKTKEKLTLFDGFRPLSGSFFLYLRIARHNLPSLRFRPLSGSFFLYFLPNGVLSDAVRVSVPYRGLSFYMVKGTPCNPLEAPHCFRPLSGSFFLYINWWDY